MNGHNEEEIDLLVMHGGEMINHKYGPITKFQVHGEMAMITWFRQTLKNGAIIEYNPKYIQVIQYKAKVKP